MMVEAASGDEWSASNAPPAGDGDKWHVALAPDEVKIVSLEQLDDLYRLSIVDSETKVWQEGMSEWQPLGVIAGLDDQPTPEPQRSRPKPPSRRSEPPTPPPLRSVQPSVQPAPPSPRSVPPAPRSAPPAPRSAPTAPRSAPLAPPLVTRAPVAVASAYTEPSALAPVLSVPPLGSVRPLTVTHAPLRRVGRGGGLGRSLLGLAVVAGVSVTLYRNGIVRDAASSLRQDALYARLERALGGPAFGTPRSVEQSTSVQAAAPLRVDDPRTEESPSTALSVTSARRPVATTQGIAGAAPAVVSLESLGRENAAAAKSTTRASAIAKTVEKEPATVAEKSDARTTTRQRLNTAAGRSMTSSKSSAQGKSNEYDPLNPKL